MTKLLIDEEGSRRVVPLGDDPITVGRDGDNLVVIRDPKSSRVHCRISPSAAGYLVEDLGSSNGTSLNGQLLARAMSLVDGDVISIGEVHMTFTGSGVAASAPPPGATARPAATPTRSAAPKAQAPQETRAKPVATPAPSILEEDDDDAPLLEEGSGGDANPTVTLDDGSTVEVERSPFSIGRKSGNDLVLDDAKVSGKHARIVQQGGAWYIEDLDSGNGIVISDRRVKRLPLGGGQVLKLGNSNLTIGGLPSIASSKPKTRQRPLGTSTSAQLLAGLDEGGISEADISRLDVQPVLAQSSGLQVVFTLLFCAGMVAILYFGWVLADRFLGVRNGYDPDNLLREIASFEGGSDAEALTGWSVEDRFGGDGVSITSVAPDKGARHGKRVLKVECSKVPDAGYVRVATTDVYEVTGSEGVRASGSIRNDGFDLATVEIIWLSRGGDGYVEQGSSFATPTRPGANYRHLSVLDHAPVGIDVDAVRVALWARGKGSLLADEMSLSLEAAERSPVIEQSVTAAEDRNREIRFRYQQNGAVTFFDGRARLLRDLRLTTTDVQGTPLGQLLPYNLEPFQVLENGSVRGSFSLLDGSHKEIIAEQFASRVGSLQRFRWQLATPTSHVALALDLENRAVQLSMALFSGGEMAASGSLADLNGVTGDEWAIGKDSRQLILGFSSPLTLRVLPEKWNRAGETLVLLESPTALPGGSLELFVSTLSTREQERIQESFARVSALRERQRCGEAIKLLARLDQQFSHIEEVRNRVKGQREEIVDGAQSDLQRVEAMRDEFQRYRAKPVQEALTTLVTEYLENYEGMAETKEVARVAEGLSSVAQSNESAGDEARLAQIKEWAEIHFSQSRNELARYYYEWIATAHAGTRDAEEATHKLDLIRARQREDN